MGSFNFSKEYQAGKEAGFEITDVKTKNILAEDSRSMSTQITIEAKTPYVTQDDTPVTAYGFVDSRDAKQDGMRYVHSAELFANGHNLDYDPSIQMQDKDGNPVPLEQGRDAWTRFAAAASEYPSVLPYGEWHDAEKVKREMLMSRNPGFFGEDFAEPSADDYEKYLGNCRGLMRDAKFIGEYTSPKDLSRARATYDEYIEDQQVEQSYDRAEDMIQPDRDDTQFGA